MAIKYYCDGCDREIDFGKVEKMSVVIKQAGSVASAGGEYEVCKDCAATLIRQADPLQWGRCRPASAA